MFLLEANMLAEVRPSYNWSSMLLLQSESFVNLNAFSLQNDAPLVLNKHLISIIGVYLKLSLEIMACGGEWISLVTFLSDL